MTGKESNGSDLDIEDLDARRDTKKPVNFEEFINKNKVPLILILCGLTLVGLGAFLYKQGYFGDSNQIEVIENATDSQNTVKDLVVEIAGAVEKPGVYKLPTASRVEDLLVIAGGLSADADREWIEKIINRAAVLSDGQKIFIPKAGESSQTQGVSAKNAGGDQSGSGGVIGVFGQLVNINTASQKDLEELPGIGPVYAQSIIEHRPYSTIEELQSKGALKKNVYEKIKNSIAVY